MSVFKLPKALPDLMYATAEREPQIKVSPLNKMVPVGVNCGFGFTKISTSGLRLVWPSVTSVYDKPDWLEDEDAQADSTRPHVVHLKEGSFEVGWEAVKQQLTDKVAAREFAQSTWYLALATAACQVIARVLDDQPVMMCIGIAADHYKAPDIREQVRAVWKRAMAHTGLQGDFRIMSELQGGLETLDGNKTTGDVMESERTCVLDFGRFTTGLAVATQGEWDAKQMYSFDVGMTKVLHDATRAIASLTELHHLSDLDIEQSAFCGRPIKYMRPDPATKKHALWQAPVQEALETAAEPVWRRVAQVARAHLNSATTAPVILVGGGASLFEPFVRASFPKANIIKFADAQFANALGLEVMARNSKPSPVEKSARPSSRGNGT